MIGEVNIQMIQYFITSVMWMDGWIGGWISALNSTVQIQNLEF